MDIMSALVDHGANVNQQDVSLCRQLCRKMFQFGMLLGHSLLLFFEVYRSLCDNSPFGLCPTIMGALDDFNSCGVAWGFNPERSAVGRQKGGYPESSKRNADTPRIETHRTDGMVSLPPESSSSSRPRVQLS